MSIVVTTPFLTSAISFSKYGFIPSKNFNLQVSYNHRRRKEFALKESKGASGWAFGANIHVYKLDLGVSYAINAPKGGVFGLSVVTDLDLFK